MPAAADLFDIRPRYLRATHLVRDYPDPTALSGYVVTPSVAQALGRLTAGLAPRSTQRVWRITGDYGSGKSSLALALSQLLAPGAEATHAQLRGELERQDIRLPRVELLPVLVVASSEPLTVSVLRALESALAGLGKRSRLIERVRLELQRPHQPGAETRAVAILEEAAAHVRGSGSGAGLLVIIDELGKFLEYAALNPDRQDTYVLQTLAEAASRSGDNALFVVGLLHQGIAAYADQLSHSAQVEWEKVAGRFDEIIFDHPLEQIAALVAAALHVRVDRVDPAWATYAREQMTLAHEQGWYGSGASRTSLVDSSVGCFPLHPTVIPVMVRLFRRFGQNERSLFSFLIGNEPMALQEHAKRESGADPFYRLHHLYDYARAAFGHRLSVQSYRSHWNHIDSVIQSFPPDDEVSLRILKTVGIFNLLDSPGLSPTEEAVVLAACEAGDDPRVLGERLRDLQRSKRVLYFRGKAAGYCLWPHTSVDLDRAYEDASRAEGTEDRVLGLVQQHLDSRPIVAKRHYIETGNLRWFEVEYLQPSELCSGLSRDKRSAAGRIMVVLCRTEEERRQATELAHSSELSGRTDVLLAIPGPLRNLSGLVLEYLRWQWVESNTPELGGDPYASEEVSRQVTASRRMLEGRILDLVGVRRFAGTAEMTWFHSGEPLSIDSGRTLAEELSHICDELFPQAPRIHNELVNRRSPSSAATAARLRLIGHILSSPSAPYLGMNPEQKPPEMSMYLSVLRRTKLHRESEGGWILGEPDEEDDPGNLRPVLGAIRHFLAGYGERRVGLKHVLDLMGKAPYGVSEGMRPLILAVFAAIHENEVAFYENGNFKVTITAEDFMRLIKDPRLFEVQYCRIDGIRSAVYDEILSALEIARAPEAPAELLHVVRPLCRFAARLPQYTRQTIRLTAATRAVRDTLIATQEPATLLFRDLPVACGLGPFDAGEASDDSRVRAYVVALRSAIDELRAAYPRLLERVRDTLAKTFETAGAGEELRTLLRNRVRGALGAVSDLELKSFCLRLTDEELGESKWLESIASLVTARPPEKWSDDDEETYHREAKRIGQRLGRVESLLFTAQTWENPESAHRLVITRADGTEVEEVVRLPAAHHLELAALEAHFIQALRQNGPMGLAAATRAVWAVLEETRDRRNE